MSYLCRSWSVLVWAHAGIEEVGDTIDRMLNSHADAFIFPSLSGRDRPSYHVCYSPRYAAQARRIGGGVADVCWLRGQCSDLLLRSLILSLRF
jgi:hypothetical protein